jgi:DNA helicase-2/ATP-dependent DNA helicase PcrA
MNTPTDEQIEILEYPLEPLRITAGAGTGKTTTMAARLATIVAREPGIDPEHALGVTFTNKAAEELSDRIRSFLPDLAAEGRHVEVSTYHGFAHSIIREYGALLGMERNAQVITPGYVRELVRRALGDGSYDGLDLTAAGHRIEEVVSLASALGDHLVQPDAVLDLDESDEMWLKRRELLDAVRRYQELKRDLGVVDYADLISGAQRVVCDNPDAAARIRARYRVVLLDEYQDTNPAQRELLQALFGDGFPVTAVGDPDQTIYEWRGASLENFAKFPEHFRSRDGTEAPDRQLSYNWRSGVGIVDIANLVRAQIGTTSSLDQLRPRPQAPQGWVGHGWYRTASVEAAAIAEEVRRLHTEEAVEWSEMAVLFRKNAQIARVRDALTAQDVPIEVAALGGLLDVPEVSDLHAWLRLLGRSEDAPALMRILLGSRFRLGLADVAPLAGWVRSRRPTEEGDEHEGAPGWAMLEAVDSMEEVQGLGDETRRRLAEFVGMYRDLLEDAQGLTLVSLCRRILELTATWPEVEALHDASRLSTRLNLYRFLDLAEEWSPLQGRPSLEAFLDYLDALQEEKASEELDTARLSGADAVALLTVHRSKGLEWPVVFLPAICKDTFPSRAQRFDDPDRFPDLLPYELRRDRAHFEPLPVEETPRKEELRRRHLEQEWRTAYVATTRAKDRLYLTGAYWFTDKRAKEPSELFDLVAGSGLSQEIAACAEPGPAPEYEPYVSVEDPDPVYEAGENWSAALRRTATDPSWPRRRAVELGVEAAYDARVDQIRLELENLPEPVEPEQDSDRFSTSVTGLVTYASCPKRFMWSEVDRLPRRTSAAARRGTELHRRIELHNRGTVPLDDDLTGFYDVEPGEQAEPPSADAFTSFQGSRFAVTKPRFIEVPFDLRIDEARIRGRIDAIYEDDEGWEIVDYKSGRPSNDPSRRVQLEAYAVAAVEVPFASERPGQLRVTFAYFGDGVAETSEAVDVAWISGARGHLADLVAAASAEQYEPTPSPACHSCDFLRFCDEGKAWVEANPRA